MEAAQDLLNRAAEAISNAVNPLPAPLLKEMEKAGNSSEDAAAESDADPTGDADDDESWKRVALGTLTNPAISPRYVKALTEHDPPIVTMGEFADWNEKKGWFLAQDIPGIGDAGQNEIEGAMASFWERREAKMKASRKAKLPSVESLSSHDGRCDGLCGWEEFLSDIETLLTYDRYDFAGNLLSGIHEWVESNKHCTKAQREAVENIRDSVDDQVY